MWSRSVCAPTSQLGSESPAQRGPSTTAWIKSGTVDQRDNIRHGRWQRALSAVPLVSQNYKFATTRDPLSGECAVVDALLVESRRIV